MSVAERYFVGTRQEKPSAANHCLRRGSVKKLNSLSCKTSEVMCVSWLFKTYPGRRFDVKSKLEVVLREKLYEALSFINIAFGKASQLSLGYFQLSVQLLQIDIQ